MHLDNILYATQYYRAPTPLKNEWGEDIAKLSELSLDAFKIIGYFVINK